MTLSPEDFRKRMDGIREADAVREIEGAHCEEDNLLCDLLDAAIDQGQVPLWIQEARDEMRSYVPPDRWYA